MVLAVAVPWLYQEVVYVVGFVIYDVTLLYRLIIGYLWCPAQPLSD